MEAINITPLINAAISLAARLRSEGRAVDLSLSPQKPKGFFKWSGEGNASHAIFIGPDDLAKGSVRMKDLDTREETVLPL